MITCNHEHLLYEQESERTVKARARSYSIEIVSTDDPRASVSEIIGESGDRVALLLNKRQHWTYTVFAYGCQMHPVSITSEISESNDLLVHVCQENTKLLSLSIFGSIFLRP